MKGSALLSPPEGPGPAETPRAPERELLRPRAGVEERNRQWRRAVRWGVLGAIFLHLLVVRISPLFVQFAQILFQDVAPSAEVPPAQGVQVVLLRELQVEPPPRIRERPPAREPEPETPTSEEAAPGEPAPTAAERLRPRVGDWRLLVPPPLPERARTLTPAERAALLNDRVRALLAEANDSAAAAASREAAALDWTVGEEGNRWGVSPGQIHLGEITLPLPFTLGPNAAQAREQAERRESYDAIRRQAGQGAADETFEERVKAIRERREAERKAKEQESPPDTAQKKP